jgi:hypothetical protein
MAVCTKNSQPYRSLSNTMFETVCNVIGKYGGTLTVIIGGLINELLLVVFWAMTSVGAVVMLSHEENCRSEIWNDRAEEVCDLEVYSGVWAIFVFSILSLYWTSQVIENVVCVTLCGVFGAFYFLEGTPQMPKGSVTLGALKRALTTAFGSVCYGLLIVTLAEAEEPIMYIREIRKDMPMDMLDDVPVDDAASPSTSTSPENWECDRYSNSYAFPQVAIYGKPFSQAGRDTWTLMIDRGVAYIIINIFVGDDPLNIITLVIGSLACECGYIYLNYKYGNFIEENSDFKAIVLICCFVIGLVMRSIVIGIINSGVTSTLVALAEEPMALARTRPELFEEIRKGWPEVVASRRD